MEKSRGTTDQHSTFYGQHHAHLREWGWAFVLMAVGWVSHSWRSATWEANLKNLPAAHPSDLLCWLEDMPGGRHHAWRSKEPNAKPRVVRESDSKSQFPQDAPPLDLNAIDESALQRLPGFGPVLSKRTMKFKNALGGFCSVDQLYLVYGLDSNVVDRNRHRFVVHHGDLTPLCINVVGYKELVKHPLFDPESVRRVLRARGRGVESMSVLWSRLDETLEERKLWEPYLQLCHEE